MKRFDLTENQVNFIEEIIKILPMENMDITKNKVNEHLFELNIFPKNEKSCPIKFKLIDTSEVLIFIEDVGGAYYEGEISNLNDIKGIIETILRSEIQIENYIRKGKNVSNKIRLYIDGKEIDTFIYTEKLFWKFFDSKKKTNIYPPWIKSVSK